MTARTLITLALSIPAFWLAMPSGGSSAVAAGVALFLWLGGLYTVMQNAAPSYFLVACPDKAEQVAGSVGINLATGVGSGILGSFLGSWLVTVSGQWAPQISDATGLSMLLSGDIGVFRLYFLLLLPLLAATILSTLHLRKRK